MILLHIDVTVYVGEGFGASHLVQVVLQIGQEADVEAGDALLVHYVLGLEVRLPQLLKLLQTLGHVSDLHGVADRLDEVRQLLEPVRRECEERGGGVTFL